MALHVRVLVRLDLDESVYRHVDWAHYFLERVYQIRYVDETFTNPS